MKWQLTCHHQQTCILCKMCMIVKKSMVNYNIWKDFIVPDIDHNGSTIRLTRFKTLVPVDHFFLDFSGLDQLWGKLVHIYYS